MATYHPDGRPDHGADYDFPRVQPGPAQTLRQQAAQFRQSALAARRGATQANEQALFMEKRAVEFELSADALDPMKPGQAFASTFPADVAQQRYNTTHSPADMDGGYVANRIRKVGELRPSDMAGVTEAAGHAQACADAARAAMARVNDARATRPILDEQSFTTYGEVEGSLSTANEARRPEERAPQDQQWRRETALRLALDVHVSGRPMEDALAAADKFRRFLAGEPEPQPAPAATEVTERRARAAARMNGEFD